MSKRLFTFPHDAEHEAESLRSLLREHNIDFYETPGSQWTFSRAAIWIKEEQEFDAAQKLLQQHIIRYAENARLKYQAETGYNPNAPISSRLLFLLTHLYRKKIPLILLILAVVLLYLYMRWFINLFNH